MSVPSARVPLIVLSAFLLNAFLFALFGSASLSAQQPKVLAPHKPIAPRPCAGAHGVEDHSGH